MNVEIMMDQIINLDGDLLMLKAAALKITEDLDQNVIDELSLNNGATYIKRCYS